MRYLIAETDWTLMTLAAELAANGTLMTRTDRMYRTRRWQTA